MAAANNKNVHLALEERQHIEISINNGAIKKSIADTHGKDKPTIGKEIKLRRSLNFRCKHPIDCISYQKYKQKNTGGAVNSVIITNLSHAPEETAHPVRATIAEMDTDCNNSNVPFIQTFKFLKYDLLLCVYHTVKATKSMRNEIFYLEENPGTEIFSREVMVLLTDRSAECTFSDEAELRNDGTRRTRTLFCDSMSSWQKSSLENVHILLRDICPKEVNLYNLRLIYREKADRCSSHINSYPKKKLNGKSSFQLLEFLSPDMAQKLYSPGPKLKHNYIG